MHIVILGCGRVGSLLAHRLDELGHSVAVVDQDPSAFRKLSAEFTGQIVTGVGFDRETLEAAGVAHAHAFAAVSSGDNSNIIAARVARESFGIQQVVARIYDPRRAEVYQRLGIPTVATVSWTTGQIMRRLLPMGAEDMYRDPSGTIALAEVQLGAVWLGRRASALEEAAGVRLAFVIRYGTARLPEPDLVLQEGDLVYVLLTDDLRDQVERVFERGPQEA